MAVCALLAWAASAPRASGPPARGEDLFKWGEYDSLIHLLDPAVRDKGSAMDRADSLEQAKSLLFLGVAFCATGKRERADEAFSRAVELDPAVELDRFYVTEEIANRFQATALRALRRHPVAIVPVSSAPSPAPQAAEPRPSVPPPTRPPRAAALARERGHPWAWIGVGAAAALTAAAGYYLFADHGGPPPDDVTRIDLSKP